MQFDITSSDGRLSEYHISVLQKGTDARITHSFGEGIYTGKVNNIDNDGTNVYMEFPDGKKRVFPFDEMLAIEVFDIEGNWEILYSIIPYEEDNYE